MKKLFFAWICLFFILITAKLSATHLVSADGHITCLKNDPDRNEYAIHLSLIRDIAASTVPFDLELDIGIYGRTDGQLKIIIQIGLSGETNMDLSATGNSYLREGTYSGQFKLPELSGGYVLQFRRCCLPSTQNLVDDTGIELLIFIPEGMQAGQHTLKRSKEMKAFLQKNKTFSHSYLWTHNLYDSIHFESKDVFSGANLNDPIPAINPTIKYSPKALFRTGFSSGNPLGSAGTWTKTSDSTYKIQMVNPGYYLYPINTTCYLNGDSFMQTVLLPLFSVDTVITTLRLDLQSVDQDEVYLVSTSKNWSSTDSISLQRNDPGMPSGQFYTIRTPIEEGTSSPIHDSSLIPASNYRYRIKLVSEGQTYYSNEVLVRTFGVGLPDVSGKQPSVHLYPNPVNKQLTIQSPVLMRYRFFSISGQLKAEGTLEEGENFLNIEHLPEGIYFLKTEFETLKIVVNDRR